MQLSHLNPRRSVTLALALATLAFSLVRHWPPARPPSAPPILSIRITHCHDGDTCLGTFLDGSQKSLRLVGIDALESTQEPREWANKSQRRLASLTVGKVCQVETLGADAYGRTLAKIFCAGIFVNQQLVREGLAFAYLHLRYRDRDFAWALRAEAKARRARRGLFSLARLPQSPHRYRQISKKCAGPQRASPSFVDDCLSMWNHENPKRATETPPQSEVRSSQ